MGIALFNKFAMPELVSLIVTTPSILASSLSSCVCFKTKGSPSRTFKVKPAGKLVRESP